MKAPANRKDSNIWQSTSTGRWHWEVQLKRKDGSAFRKAGSRKTEAEAKKCRDAAFTDYNKDEGKAGKWTIKTWLENCLENIWPNNKKALTLQTYRYMIDNHIIPNIGPLRLDSLDVMKLQAWMNTLQASEGRSIARNAKTALSAALTDAMQQELIRSNPARLIKIKGETITEKATRDDGKMILTESQQAKLIESAVGSNVYLPIMLGLKTGMRISECLGLTWKNVDLGKRIIHVRQQRYFVKGQGMVESDPKSNSGHRELYISNSLYTALVAAKKQASSSHVCARENGCLTDSSQASREIKAVGLRAFGEGASLPTHHDLRSTFLTWLANDSNNKQGVKPHVLMKIAGHSDLATTMNYYVRASDDDIKQAMQGIA